MQWLCVLLVVCLTPFLVSVIFNQVIDLAYRGRQAQSGKKIILAFQIYANDNGSTFPDVRAKLTTANQVFRDLIGYDIVDNEQLFSGEVSPYQADGFIGDAPDFKAAVQPGENHWVVLGGLTTSSYPRHPAIYENALDSTWPPRWKPDSALRPIRGRVWQGNKIIVGFVDGSISIVKTRQVGETLTLPESMLLGFDGKPWDDIKVLDIEEKKAAK
jgi:hypothetical protein